MILGRATVDYRLRSWANVREHYRAKDKRVAEERALGRWLGQRALRTVPATSAVRVVYIERIGPRRLDCDNMVACCKQLRDGIADALGVDDGPRGGIRWEYHQSSRGAGVYAITIALGDGVTASQEVNCKHLPEGA